MNTARTIVPRDEAAEQEAREWSRVEWSRIGSSSTPDSWAISEPEEAVLSLVPDEGFVSKSSSTHLVPMVRDIGQARDESAGFTFPGSRAIAGTVQAIIRDSYLARVTVTPEARGERSRGVALARQRANQQRYRDAKKYQRQAAAAAGIDSL